MRLGIGIYVKGSAEAVELYKAAFGLTLGYHVLNDDGSYYHSELMRGEEEIFDVVESPAGRQEDHTVQVGMIMDDEDAVRHAFALLAEGGSVETPLGPLPWSPLAASLRDKFGVWWYITAPQFYPGDDFDPNSMGGEGK